MNPSHRARIRRWWRRGYPIVLVAVASAMGQSITWSTFLGGSSDDYPRAVAADAAGNVYAAGDTTSTDFLAPDSPRTLHSDTFVAKFDPTGKELRYLVRLGGSGVDRFGGLAVDADGTAYVTGVTEPGAAPFPTTGGAVSQRRGTSDTFVVRLNPAGETVYATLLGSDGPDAGKGIALDSAGNPWVLSQSHTAMIPGVDTSTAVRVNKLDGAGRVVLEYRLGEIGGQGWNYPGRIAIDAEDGIWITGSTNWSLFPIVGSEPRPVPAASTGFLARLNTVPAVAYSTVDIERFAQLVRDPAGNMHTWTRTEPRHGPLMLRSEDAGANWQSHDFLDRYEPLSDLRFAPGSAGRLYAGAQSGIIRSDHGGRTWRSLLTGGWSFWHFALHPTNPDVLFAGDSFFGGDLRRSTDGGATWTQLWRTEWGVPAMLADPESPVAVYACECSYLGTRVVKLTDGGNEFVQVGELAPDQCPAAMEASAGAIFALTTNGSLLRSSNGGEQWETVRGGLRGIRGHRSTLYAWSDNSLSKTADRGESWTPLARGVFHSLSFDPASEGTLYASTSEGILKSVDGGTKWNLVAEGGGPASVAVDPQRPATVYAGFANRTTYPARPTLRRLDGSTPARLVRSAAGLPAELAALDNAGNLYVTGSTTNGSLGVVDALQPEFGGGVDTFLTAIATDGKLTLATYLGSWDTDQVTGIAIDSQGNILLTGWTASERFPVKNALQPAYRANIDGFVVKIAPR